MEHRVGLKNLDVLAFSVPQFCEVFCIGKTKLYGEIRSGRLRSSKIGNKTIIRASDAAKWLEALPQGHALTSTHRGSNR